MDRYSRERQRTGSAILTALEVARIKRNLNNGMSPGEIAEAYGVARETIRRIARKESWLWVDAEEELPEKVALPPEAQAEMERLAAKFIPKPAIPHEEALTLTLSEANQQLAKTQAITQQLDELKRGD